MIQEVTTQSKSPAGQEKSKDQAVKFCFVNRTERNSDERLTTSNFYCGSISHYFSYESLCAQLQNVHRWASAAPAVNIGEWRDLKLLVAPLRFYPVLMSSCFFTAPSISKPLLLYLQISVIMSAGSATRSRRGSVSSVASGAAGCLRISSCGLEVRWTGPSPEAETNSALSCCSCGFKLLTTDTWLQYVDKTYE